MRTAHPRIDLPYGPPTAVVQWRDAEDAMRGPGATAGRLSAAPPEGVNRRDLSRCCALPAGRAGSAPGGASQASGCGQALGRQVAGPVVRVLVCCIMTGASAPSSEQPTCPRPIRCPTS